MTATQYVIMVYSLQVNLNEKEIKLHGREWRTKTKKEMRWGMKHQNASPNISHENGKWVILVAVR